MLTDAHGIRWQRYDPLEYITTPKYKIRYTGQQISKLFTDKADISLFIPLPFYSVPMWPIRDDLKWYTYEWCFCCLCDKQFSDDDKWCCLILCTTFKKLRVRLVVRLACVLCTCSKIKNASGLTFYPFILYASTDVSDVLKPHLEKFVLSLSSQPTRSRCCVCDKQLEERVPRNVLPICKDDDLCLKTRSTLERWATGTELYNSFEMLPAQVVLEFLHRMRNVNIIFSLVHGNCHRDGCPRNAATTVFCKTCTRVAYCSRACKRASIDSHLKSGCVSWKNIWDPKSIILR